MNIGNSRGLLLCILWGHVRTQGVFKEGIILERVDFLDPTIM
jgi:hypothetical protein